MYKKILIVASIVAGLTSCNGDYTDWVMPETNTQQDAKTTTLVATPVSDVIDLETVTTDSVQVVTFGEMPTVSSFTATYNITYDDITCSVPIDQQGRISAKDLKTVIATLYGRSREVRTLSGTISAVATTLPTSVQNPTTLRLETASAVSFKAEYPDQPSYFFFTGNPNSWATEASVPFFPTTADKNIQTLTTYYKSSWDGKFWYQEEVGQWDKCYTAAEDANRTGKGTFTTGTDFCFFSPEEGYYTMTINLTDKTYTFTACEDQFPAEYTKIGLIGGFNGWGSDYELTQSNDSHIWHAYNFTLDSDTELKFRANGGWDINWGNKEDFPYGIGNRGGDNMIVEAGTYDVYFNDITGEYLFIAK